MFEMWWQGALIGQHSSGWELTSLVVGVALLFLGMTMRPEGKKIVWGWRSGYAENCTPAGQVVFFLGLGLAMFGMTALFPSSGWHPIGLVGGAALVALGMTMRPEGKKIVWSWAFGFAENCTPVGKVVFFLGLGLAIFGLVSLLGPLLDG